MSIWIRGVSTHPKIAENKLQGLSFAVPKYSNREGLENQKEGNSSKPTITSWWLVPQPRLKNMIVKKGFPKKIGARRKNLWNPPGRIFFVPKRLPLIVTPLKSQTFPRFGWFQLHLLAFWLDLPGSWKSDTFSQIMPLFSRNFTVNQSSYNLPHRDLSHFFREGRPNGSVKCGKPSDFGGILGPLEVPRIDVSHRHTCDVERHRFYLQGFFFGKKNRCDVPGS